MKPSKLLRALSSSNTTHTSSVDMYVNTQQCLSQVETSKISSGNTRQVQPVQHSIVAGPDARVETTTAQVRPCAPGHPATVLSCRRRTLQCVSVSTPSPCKIYLILHTLYDYTGLWTMKTDVIYTPYTTIFHAPLFIFPPHTNCVVEVT